MSDFWQALDGFIGTSTVMTWVLMAMLMVLAWFLHRDLQHPGLDPLQNLLEMFMEQLCDLIREIVRRDPRPYVPLAGTLFIFVFCANLMGMVPGLESPTGDIAVTAGLATVVFCAVPFFGVRAVGIKGYLRNYIQPNPFMLPFNLMGEFTRTLALAVRLFGNIMSGNLLFLILVGVITTVLRSYAMVFYTVALPLTIFVQVLSLITAVIQAYIFTVLALVYIGAATETAPTPAGVQDTETQSQQ